MTNKIAPGSQPFQRSLSEGAQAETLVPGSHEIDALLARKSAKPTWHRVDSPPMMLDPVTRRPMVDPVLCQDGKLHDRATVHAIAFLDPDMTAPRTLAVKGHDLEARAAVHNAYPVAQAMFRERRVLSARFTPPAPAPGKRATRAAAEFSIGAASETTPANTASLPLSLDEKKFRQYQLRARRGSFFFDVNTNTGFSRSAKVPRPFTFSRSTFSHFGILPAMTAHRLVEHLVKYRVLLGSSRSSRFLGCTEFLDEALDAYRGSGGALSEAQKKSVRQYIGWFEKLHDDAFKAVAEMDGLSRFIADNEHFRLTFQVQNHREANRLSYDSERALLRLCRLRRDTINGIGGGAGAEVREKLWQQHIPAPKRTQSLQDLRLGEGPENGDADVFYCPLFLEAAPSPVLCSDGHSYDLSQVLEGRLTTSPLTREPMHVVGRHDEKQRYASRLIEKQDADYFQETYEGLRDAYAPRKGGFEDSLVSYQRRRRFLSTRARPDSLSANVFYEFVDGITRSESQALVVGLEGWGILNRAARRSIVADTSKAAVRDAMDNTMKNFQLAGVSRRTDFSKLGVSQRSDLVRVITTLSREQARRAPLVAQARILAAQLALAPEQTPRRMQLQKQLDVVTLELTKLPSGAYEKGLRKLY